ncbi:MAG: vWA domain-containing protein, partial [Candidatus Xenobia bacterium]
GDFREAIRLKRDVSMQDLQPKEVYDQAKDCAKIVKEKLWPVYKQLVEDDISELGNAMFGNQGAQGSQSGQGGQGSQQSKDGKESKEGKQGNQSGQNGKAQGNQQGQQGQQSQQSQNGQGQQSQQGGQGQQSQQNQNQQGGGGQQSQDQKNQQSGQQNQSGGQSSGAPQNQQNQQGGGGGQPSQDQKDQQGGGGQSGDKNAGQQNGAPQNQQSNGGGQGNNPMPDPLKDDDKKGSAAGQGQDKSKSQDPNDNNPIENNLTQEQRDKARQILEGLDKSYGQQNLEKRENRQDNQEGQQQQNAGGQGAGGNGGSTSQIDLPTLQELLEKKQQVENQVENLKTPYEKFYSQMAPFTTEMVGELRNILTANAEPKFIGYYSTGKKLSLRAAMQSEAQFEKTGQLDPNIWMRRDEPSKRDYDFVFMLDESGSMMDQLKWDNAIKALIMQGEALEELKINFGVVGFSDYPKVHKEMSDKYDELRREQMLSDIQASPHGGTNDSDAMQIALQMVMKGPSDHKKVVIVITDGDGKKAEERALCEEAEKKGITVIGVGIGDGMSTVKQVYPHQVYVDHISDLPMALSDCVREQIVGAFDQHNI